MSEQASFSELARQANLLTSDMDTGSELPRVERNLKQLLEAGQQLWARTAQTGAQDVKASILLGSKGVDLPSISTRLEALDASRTFQPLEPVRDTDIAGFLRNERENAILTVIEQSRKQTFEQVDKFHWEAFQSTWELEKQRILATLATSGQDLLDVSLQPELSTSALSTTVAGQRSTLTAQEHSYVEVIGDYIERVSQGGRKPDLVSTCRDLMRKLGDDIAVELWDTVRCVTHVQVRSPVGRFSAAVQAALIQQAKRFLESSYSARLQRLVRGNLATALLGGVPGTRQLVQSYLAVRPPSAATDNTLVDGLTVWPVIYHCLRCGDAAAARDAAAQAGPHLQEMRRMLDELARDGHLSAESEAAVRLQYRRSSAAGTDPYTRAVYSALGASDVTDTHSELDPDIHSSTEDFLWLKLSGLSALAGEAQQSALAQLQTMLLEEYGEAHFDAYNQPSLYFRVLLLTGQLEAAVEFVARIERLRPHAVHMALALHELDLLQLSSSTQAPLLSSDAADARPRRRLNLARLVLMYTRRFEGDEPQSALHYLFLLRQLRLDDGGDLFAAATAELALESRSYEQLLGRLGADGTRQKGALDRYNFDPRPVIERVAAESESRGQLEDAVQLYDLANNHDKVLELLNRLLSQLVTRPAAEGSRRQQLQLVAVAIAKRFKEVGTNGSPEAAGTLYLLLDLMSLFDLYHLERRSEALSVVRRLRLLPAAPDQLEACLTRFSRLQEEVRRCVPDLLLVAMTLLQTAAPVEGAAEVRKQARALITYAGSLPYRLPGDTHARLVQMEVLMN